MSEFWGYLGADALAFIVIASATAMCLVCARIFVHSQRE